MIPFSRDKNIRPATLLKKGLWHRCFPMNFAQFLRTPFLQNTSGRLLLSEICRIKFVKHRTLLTWKRLYEKVHWFPYDRKTGFYMISASVMKGLINVKNFSEVIFNNLYTKFFVRTLHFTLELSSIYQGVVYTKRGSMAKQRFYPGRSFWLE